MPKEIRSNSIRLAGDTVQELLASVDRFRAACRVLGYHVASCVSWYAEDLDWAAGNEVGREAWIKRGSGYIRLGEQPAYFRELPAQVVARESQSPPLNLQALFDDAATRARGLGCTVDEAHRIEGARRFFEIEHLACARFSHHLFATLYTNCTSGIEPGGLAVIGLPLAFAAPKRSFSAGEISVPVASHAMALQELAIEIVFSHHRQIWSDHLAEAAAFGWSQTANASYDFLSFTERLFASALDSVDCRTLVEKCVSKFHELGDEAIDAAINAPDGNSFNSSLAWAATFLEAASWLVGRRIMNGGRGTPPPSLAREAVVVEEKLVRTWEHFQASALVAVGLLSHVHDPVLAAMLDAAKRGGLQAAHEAARDAVLNKLNGSLADIDHWIEIVKAAQPDSRD